MSDTEHDGITYAIPLEVGFGDVRECRIDRETSCADVLLALLGRPADRATGSWAILETVYERGVMLRYDRQQQTLATGAGSKTARRRQQPEAASAKHPQLIIREIRLLEPEQPMHELLAEVCPPPNSAGPVSRLSVINAATETIVFFNPLFRHATGLPLTNLSVFPDPDMTVGQANRMIRARLGLHPDDDRFALFGNYGKHVSRLEDRCILSDLKRTWEGTTGQQERIGFFQFQMQPDRVDDHCLGIERASWLYVRMRSGLLQREKKRYCVLQGTSLFIYREKTFHPGQEETVVRRIPDQRVFSNGPNLMRTRWSFALVQVEGGGRETEWTFSSPYQNRIRKWLRVLGRCRRTFESQIPTSFEDPDGELWRRNGRGHGESTRRPFSKRAYRERKRIDPDGVPAGEMTVEQRNRFDGIDALLRAAVLSGELVKQNGEGQDPETARVWLSRVRAFAQEACSLNRPGFAAKMIPSVEELLRRCNAFAPGLKGSLRAAVMDIDRVDAVHEAATKMAHCYKQHILDLASFPSSPKRSELEHGPRMVSLRMILEDEQFYTHRIDPEPEPESFGLDPEPEPEHEHEHGHEHEHEHAHEHEIPDVNPEPESLGNDKATGGETREERFLVRKMRSLLIRARSPRPPRPAPTQAADVLGSGDAHLAPEEAARESEERSALEGVSVNEAAPNVPPRRPASTPLMEAVSVPLADEAGSIRSTISPQTPSQAPSQAPSQTSSKASSFTQKARGLWARVSSPLQKGNARMHGRGLKATATLPAGVSATAYMPESAEDCDDVEFYSKPEFYRKSNGGRAPPINTVPTEYAYDDLRSNQTPPQMRRNASAPNIGLDQQRPGNPYPYGMMPMDPYTMMCLMMQGSLMQQQQHQYQQPPQPQGFRFPSFWPGMPFSGTNAPPQPHPAGPQVGSQPPKSPSVHSETCESPFDGPPCAGCAEEIRDGQEIVRPSSAPDGAMFHSECFVCAGCGKRLSKSAYRRDGKGRLHCRGTCSAPSPRPSQESGAKKGILKTLNTIDVPKRLRTLEAAE